MASLADQQLGTEVGEARPVIRGHPNDPEMRRQIDSREPRLLWMNALKILSILGVIGIHVTADSSGLPYASYPASQRLAPSLARALSEIFNYPVFLIASLFLLALRLDRAPRQRSYSAVIRSRLKRLLPPFLLWSLVFLAVRNVKAISFGYHDYYLEELAAPISWLRYLFLGGAQYHLHFIPILMALYLLYPVYNVAIRKPALGAFALLTLGLWPSADQIIYSSMATSAALPFALTATKVAAFTGYGFVAFSLYGWYRRGASPSRRPLITAVLTVLIMTAGALVTQHSVATAREGAWLARDLATHLAHYSLPIGAVIVFLFARKVTWPESTAHLASLTFGVYLFHPIVLDALEIAERGWNLSPSATVAFNFIAVSMISFLVVALSARVPHLRIAFGITAEPAR